MKKKKKVIISVVIIFILLFIGLIIYLVSNDLEEEQILRNEIASLSKKDITKDSYDIKIKTTEDYAVVEKTIKQYIDEYAKTLQKTIKLLSDDTLSNALTATNYSSDGPEFTNTKQHLNELKESINKNIGILESMTNEQTIMKEIENKNLDQYYVDLYKELMLYGVAEDDLNKAKENLKTSTKKINTSIDTVYKVLELLVNNKDQWYVEQDKIIFKNNDLANQYNELVNTLK